MSARDRVALTPASEEQWLAWRTQDVTSTESAALFGLSPYTTAFALWHHKRDQVALALEPNERMDWGNDLQDAIALSLGRRYGVRVERITTYMRLPDARMGSSFDFRVYEMADIVAADTVLQDMLKRHGPGLLEIKNVDRAVFADKWVKRLSDEERANGSRAPIEPPGHIDIQVQHQLHVAGMPWAAIGVLVGGNTGRLVTRLYDPVVGSALEARIRKFWETIEAGTEPQPAYPSDAAFVASLYKTSVDRVFDGRGNDELDTVMTDYCEALAREKAACEDKEVAKAKALRIIGSAERAYTDRYTVSAKEVAPSRIESFERKGYRGWRVTAKKGRS